MTKIKYSRQSIFAYPCDLLDEFLRHIFREKFGPELKLKRRFFLDVLTLNLNKTNKNNKV